MTHRHVHCWLIITPVCLALAACGGYFVHHHVPSESQGDVALTIVNAHTFDLCQIQIAPQGSQSTENWLSNSLGEERGMAPTETITFKVKPGQYRLYAESCNHDFKPRLPAFTVSGPTYLAIGNGNNAPPQGVAVVRAGGRTGDACIDHGFPFDNVSQCCSKQKWWRPEFEGGKGAYVCD
jgi:hypothetical protein